MIAGRGTYGAPRELSWGGVEGRLIVRQFCSLAIGYDGIARGEHHTDQVTTYPFAAFPPAVFQAAAGATVAR